MSGVVLEARPFRPFKSSEEYLYAMKEDLAEWFQTLYPHLRINVDNFMDRLETGVALCEHANAVKVQAQEYVQKKQAKKIMSRSVTGSLAQAHALMQIPDVKYFSTAKPGTFFSRDNVSNFIHWCRQSLKIIECLLFETDDLIMRKNEKHVILCLLEVARRGARFGMLAPMLIQMERQIDREIAADQRKLLGKCVGTSDGFENQNGEDESDSDMEDEKPMLMYGPLPQIITNDLKSLDEMVRDLVEKCTCPTQFPMIRVSEGKYRIGDTKVLIFVRILRNHVMVRVGGGWDTLSHYLDKHDPCRCRTQHRSTQGARFVSRPGASDLHRAQVYYDRSPPRNSLPNSQTNGSGPTKDFLGPPMNSLNRSRSPSHYSGNDSRRSVSPNMPRKNLAPPSNRSRSPTPNFISTHTTKLSSPKHSNQKGGSLSPSSPQSLPYIPTTFNSSPLHGSPKVGSKNGQDNTKLLLKSETSLQVSDHSTDHSDNASEVSDEGYRSLGLVQDKNKNRTSLISQNSIEDAEENEHHNSLDYEDETNDAGLRKTKFSFIYNNGQSKSAEETPQITKEKSFERPKSKPVSRSNSYERNVVKSKPSKNTNSVNTSVGKKQTPIKSTTNTWSGRQKSTRPSLSIDTFSPPSSTFTRNNPARRSLCTPKKTSHSANTSPTKGKLREELLRTVKSNKDDEIIAEQVKKLLRKYGSLSVLDGGDEETLVVNGEDIAIQVSPRRDSRSNYNRHSRIPAPVSQKI